ncbi:uncharacterized protein LOC133187196 isoform X2 [Saccostrea echinata]|uniref:uncharacterized protein LOC133187196 isoform X2 n=1 Tax=Saccostrea echinata TaxID=191078 RepID=UPI002A80ACC0|nr:uncharacterized protein LOC133187196 isoform X2 [Saccostrea echinata]
MTETSQPRRPSLPSRDKWRFVASDKEYSVEEFYSMFHTTFPCVSIVTQGYFGDIGIEVIGKEQAIYIQKLSRQQRVVADIISGEEKCQISIPTAYRARFCVVEKHGKSTIYEEIMLLPFYLNEIRLSMVTGILGYPSSWSSYLQNLSVAKLPDSGKYGNSDIAIYRKTGLQSFESSGAVPETYLSISAVNVQTGHQYEDLQKKEQIERIYDIIWDSNSGCSVVKERQSGIFVPQETKQARYIQWKEAKLSKSLPADASMEKRYAERPLPTPPKISQTESESSKEKQLTYPKDSDEKSTQQTQSAEVPTNEDQISAKEIKHSIDREKQPQMAKSQIQIKNELEKELSTSTNFEMNQNFPTHSKVHDSSKLPPVPKRPARNKGINELLAPDMAAERQKRIPSMSVSEVTYWLGVLKLEQYADTFKENDVDGVLLSELDDSILKNEFGMSRFHAIKLRKFISEGYIPRQ